MASLFDLNDRIFRELGRLEAMDMDDEEARDAEIARAKVIGNMAGRAIELAKTAMMAAQMTSDAMDDLAVQTAVPRLLIGEADVKVSVER